MFGRTVSAIVIAMLLTSTLTLAVNIQSVETELSPLTVPDDYQASEVITNTASRLDSEWPMFHHDLMHTGKSDSTAPNTNSILWIFTMGPSTWFSSPAVADGKVFIGSSDTRIYALNETNGAYIWSYATALSTYSSPAVADGKVFIGSGDANVYALNETTGQYIWSYPTGSFVDSSPVVADGMVFIGSNDHHVYALNESTGRQVWNYTTVGGVKGSPAVADGMVFAGTTENYRLYALNETNGNLVWTRLSGDVKGSPAVADGMVFVGADDCNIKAFDERTGDSVWNYTTDLNVWSSPAVADGMVFAGSIGGTVYALNEATGGLVWDYHCGRINFSPPAVADGKVFIGSNDGRTYALDEATGAHIWNYTTGYASNPVVADGNLFVSSAEGKVYAFHTPVPTYNVTINAHCNTEGADLNMPIMEDGSYTLLDTPHTFTGLAGTHNFTVWAPDFNNHPFAYWDSAGSGQTSTTISVSNAGTHTAFYQVLPYSPQEVTASPMNQLINLTWKAPNPPPGYTVQSYKIYRGTTPDFAIPWNSPYHTVYATMYFQDSIQDNNIYYYRVSANFQQGLGAPSDSVGCARLESFKGIANDLVGTSTLNVNDWWTCVTFQQNFFINTSDASGNRQYYWCQNCVVKTMNLRPPLLLRVSGSMWVWGPVDSIGQIGKGTPKTHKPGSAVWTSCSDEIKFASYIDGSSLVMQNSHWGPETFDLGLSSDAHVFTLTQNYPPSSAVVIPGIESSPPNFVIVGDNGGLVNFTGGTGHVSSRTKIGDCWICGTNIDVANSIKYCAPALTTMEGSEGLIWATDGYFSPQVHSKDEGLFFMPDFGSAVVGPITFNTASTTGARALTVVAMCPVYLGIYDDFGGFIGFNSTSGSLEDEIPTAVWRSNQSIVIFDPNGTYHLEVTGTENGTFTLETSWQDISGATYVVSNITNTITENETQVYDVGANSNVTLTNITSKTVVGQGLTLQVNATVADIGGPNATFDVSLYTNGTLIGIQSALNVSGWNSTTACFIWNTTGYACGNYTLSASVQPTNTSFTDAWVIVSIVGDITGPDGWPDGKVNMYDVGNVARRFMAKPPSPDYDPNFDINGDGIINMIDIGTVARHFGETIP